MARELGDLSGSRGTVAFVNASTAAAWKVRMGGVLVGVAAFAVGLGGCASDPQLTREVGVSPDGLVLGFGIGTCNADITTTVEETPTEVIVTPEVRNNDRGSDCRDAFTVTLAEPLDGRVLIDGRNGDVLDTYIANDLEGG